jgi:hypothetical protein
VTGDAAPNGGYLIAGLLFQFDPSTPVPPSRLSCLFMIAKRSNVLSCRVESGVGGVAYA